jgi:hypothetical protein
VIILVEDEPLFFAFMGKDATHHRRP